MSAVEMNIVSQDFLSKGGYFWIAYLFMFALISFWTYYDRGDFHYHIDRLRRGWRSLRNSRRMTCRVFMKTKN